MDNLSFPLDIPEDVQEEYHLPGGKPDIRVNRKLNREFGKVGINCNSALLFKKNERDYKWDHAKQIETTLETITTTLTYIHDLMLGAEEAHQDAVEMPAELLNVLDFLGVKWPPEDPVEGAVAQDA